jgi:hypothetical protein
MPQDHAPFATAELIIPERRVTRERRVRPDRPRGYLFDDALYRSLREMGLSVRIEFDIEDFKSFIRSTEWPIVNSAADPTYHDFVAGEVFWMRLAQGDETIATQVFRMVTTDDYVSMVRDHTLFFGDRASGFRDFRLLADGVPRIGGLVVQLSGLYIRPDWRRTRTADGIRLVAAWTRLSHSFTLRNLMADWSVSLVEGRIASARTIEDLYGYPNWGELFETYEPALGRFERVMLMWMSAGELAGSVASRPRLAGQSCRHVSRLAN